jgi:3-oxoacyl-[acyl-carrier protein] reductase
MDEPLAGRAALVTGASRRIGRAIALALAAAGADVAVHGHKDRQAAEESAKAIRDKGRRATVVLGDVSAPQAVESIVGDTVRALGRLDILVNNASVRGHSDIHDTSYEDWRRVVGITLDGAFLCVKAAVPHLMKSGSGRIINIGGATGHAGAAHHMHVVAAKAGLLGLTKALAHDLGVHGITVNMVSPGLIEADGDDPKRAAERRQVYLVDRLPLRRPGRPEEVAAAVVTLAKPESDYITGQTLHVNGGALMP